MHGLPWGGEIDENYWWGGGERVGLGTWVIRIFQLGEGWRERNERGIFMTYSYSIRTVNSN